MVVFDILSMGIKFSNGLWLNLTGCQRVQWCQKLQWFYQKMIGWDVKNDNGWCQILQSNYTYSILTITILT